MEAKKGNLIKEEEKEESDLTEEEEEQKSYITPSKVAPSKIGTRKEAGDAEKGQLTKFLEAPGKKKGKGKGKKKKGAPHAAKKNPQAKSAVSKASKVNIAPLKSKKDKYKEEEEDDGLCDIDFGALDKNK